MKILKTEEDVLDELDNLAKKLEFDFKLSDYRYILMGKEFFLIDYHFNYQKQHYEKFGKTFEERKKNKSKFFQSNLLNQLSNEPAGITLYGPSKILSFVKSELPKTFEKITKYPLVLIYSKKSVHKTPLFYSFLLHEYIHILFEVNGYNSNEVSENVINAIEFLIDTRPTEKNEKCYHENKDNPLIKKYLYNQKKDN